MSVYDINGNVISTDANIDSNMIDALASDGDPVITKWGQGSISYDTGANINSDTRIRTVTYLGFDSLRYIYVRCPDGYKFAFRRYNAVKTPTYMDYEGFYTGNKVIRNTEGKLYRFIIAKVDDSNITPEELPSGFAIIPVYLSIWAKEANGNSIKAYTTTRNNPSLVSELKEVAFTYYNNRNDTHSGTRNMVYNNSDTVLDHPNDITYTNGIDCSTFVGLCLRGIPYQETSYYTLTPIMGIEYRANPQYSWSMNPFDYKTFSNRTSTEATYTRRTSQLAEWLISQRRCVEKDPSLANIEVGDVVFWSRFTGNNPMNMYRFLEINHVALVISKYSVEPYSASRTYNINETCQYDNALYQCKSNIVSPEDWTLSHWNKIYDVWDYSILPYCHIVMESTTGNPTIQTHILERSWEDPTNVTQNNYNTMSLICRPDLGSL